MKVMKKRPHLLCFSWLKEPPHQEVLRLLAQEQGEGRFVGSAVRNSLCGERIDDFDIATTHTPDRVTALLTRGGHKVYPTGLKHGTVSAHVGGFFYEITTLREDTKTDGRHAEVRFTQDWEVDAGRRDFTINALYLNAKGELTDFHEGVKDLKAGVVRFIGDPQVRIQEDYLRILRFFRFQARYGAGVFHEKSYQACLALKEGLQRLSHERVCKELSKIFEGPQALEMAHLFEKEAFWPLWGVMHTDALLFQNVSALVKQVALSEAASGEALDRDIIHQTSKDRLPFSWCVLLKSLYGKEPPHFLLERVQKAMWKALDSVLKPVRQKQLDADWVKEKSIIEECAVKEHVKEGAPKGSLKAFKALLALYRFRYGKEQTDEALWLLMAHDMSCEQAAGAFEGGRTDESDQIVLLNAVARCKQLSKWLQTFPEKRPLSGEDVKAFWDERKQELQGRKIGFLLEKGIQRWAMSDFTLSKEELLLSLFKDY